MLMVAHLTGSRMSLRRIVPCVGLALALGACANADRFTGQSIGSRPLGPAAAARSEQPTLPSAPPIATSRVETQELPPPGGAAPPSGGGTVAGLPPPADPFFQSTPPSAPTTPPPAPRAIDTPTIQGGGREIATLGGGGTSGGRGAVTSRDGVVGGWTAREATGGSCRVTLSSTPALDLYRANASGCANRDLQKVTAWDYRDGEVYLYQPGGSVAARMRVSDGSSLSGVIARSGANVSMSR
jgi:hypothetical protein